MASAETDTPAKRAHLAPRKNPYWTGVGGGRGGVSLGYRKSATGPGVWIGKVVIDGRRVEGRIGEADDKGAEAGMAFRAAVAECLAWSRQQYEAIAAAKEAGSSHAAPTVRSAIEAYTAARIRRNPKDGADAKRRLARHVLSDKRLADLPLQKLRASTLEAWRDRLPIAEPGAERNSSDSRPSISPSTVNRLLNDFRAALNAAAEKHRRELPPHLPGEIRVGTRAMSAQSNARKQFLTDDEVAALIDAAFAVDEDGDFGRLVLMLAATGARYSQVADIRVGDLQVANGRVMVPRSKKGKKAATVGRIAVPLSSETIARLHPAWDGRPLDEALLTRWHLKQVAGAEWERVGRRSWKDSEMARPWAATRKAAGLSASVVPYSLRHTSILRGLRAGLPVRLVASLHDTSVAMIEAHYSAYIVDASEELTRRAMLTIGSRPAFAEAAE